MKYSNLRAFEKHLKDAAPDHFSRIYFVISKDPFERKEAEKMFLTELAKAKGSKVIDVRHFDAEEDSVNEMFRELGSFSLFGDTQVVVIRNAESFDKEKCIPFEKYFDTPTASAYLLISAEAINRATKFYKKGEAAGIICDLVEEKPWEKENSLIARVAEWAEKAEKRLGREEAKYFVHYVGNDLSHLKSEMEKLLCYTAEKNAITTQDIRAICTGTPSENGWQLGDAVFRHDGAAALTALHAIVQDTSQFFLFLRQLRSQFQSKLQISSILSNGGGPAEIQAKYPYMKGQILQQNINAAKAYGMGALERGILAIDQAELLAKNSALDVLLIAERLIMKLST